MDQGPESKKPRLSTASWSTGPASAHLHHSFPNPSPASTASPQAPHPTLPGPYQPSHPFSRSSDPPPVSSPAPPTPSSAHAYLHLPPPQPTPQPHQSRVAHPPPPPPPPHQHYSDDRRYHEQDQYAHMQDHRPDYRHDHRPDYRQNHRPDYHSDQQQQQQQQQQQPSRIDYRQEYRQDYRHPPRSPARLSSPSYATTYGRDQSLSEDGLPQIRRLDQGSVHGPPPPPPPPPPTLPHPHPHAQPPPLSHQLANHQSAPSPNPNHQPIPLHPHAQPPPHSHVHPNPPPIQSQGPPPPSLPPPGGPSVSSTMYRPPNYPPTPTGMGQPQQYETLFGHAQPAPVPDPSFPISYAATGKKKAQRASQACDSCRSLKAKCDETKPCKNCREKNIECKYRDPIPKQQDKVTIDIMDAINGLIAEIREVRGEVKTSTQQVMIEVQKALKMSFAGASNEQNAARDSTFIDDLPTPKDGDKDGSSPKQTWPTESNLLPEVSQCFSEPLQSDDHIDMVPGPAVVPGEPAIPAYHTTLASLLLTWPTIRERVQKHLEAAGIQFPSEFPMRQEERRGAISFYGRGEDAVSDKGGDPTDPSDLLHLESSPGGVGMYTDLPGSNKSSPQGIESFNAYPEPSESTRDSWNQFGVNSPSPVDHMKGAPMRVNTELDFTPEKVWEYVHSYESNMQNIHPLIPSRDLRVMVTMFLQHVARTASQARSWAPVAEFAGGAESTPGGSAAPAGAIAPGATPAPAPTVVATPVPTGSSAATEGGGLKRKRSPGPMPEGSSPRQLPPRSGPRFQDVNSMLVLMVLALGKVCLYKHAKLPDVVPDGEDESTSSQSPQAQNGYSPSVVHDSPLSAQPSSGRNAMSRRSSLQGAPQYPASRAFSMKRNVDNIPGFDYFVEASDRVGSQVGARPQLKLVWVYIMMCLYYSQLGRPMPSLECVVLAGRQLQLLLRPLFHNFGIMKNNMPKTINRRENQLLFAFWTCLQLESDLLAELPLPQSGILAYEQQMPYPFPDNSSPNGFDAYVLESYMAQLFLRNQLNSIHKNLYDGSRNPNTIDRSKINLFTEALQKELWVPSQFKFQDEDPPANEILAARLRAKYWGAQVIIHRFFIRRIIDYNYWQRMKARDPNIVIPAEAPQESPLTQENIQLAQRGVQALVESTRAFHGLPDKRFVVTNVFGTAHAQWGNLLVLDSVQRDPVLGQFIAEDFLNNLFQRTIDFFEIISQPKSALAYDMRILKGLLHDRRLHPRRYVHPGTVVSPTTSAAPAVSGTQPISSGALQPPSTSAADASASASTIASGSGAGNAQLQQGPPRQMSSTRSGSPMHMSPEDSAPVFSPPLLGPSPPGPGLMQAPPLVHSPVQGSLPPQQMGMPSVKGPSTPSESGFPHHLPPFDQRLYRGVE